MARMNVMLSSIKLTMLPTGSFPPKESFAANALSSSADPLRRVSRIFHLPSGMEVCTCTCTCLTWQQGTLLPARSRLSAGLRNRAGTRPLIWSPKRSLVFGDRTLDTIGYGEMNARWRSVLVAAEHATSSVLPVEFPSKGTRGGCGCEEEGVSKARGALRYGMCRAGGALMMGKNGTSRSKLGRGRMVGGGLSHCRVATRAFRGNGLARKKESEGGKREGHLCAAAAQETRQLEADSELKDGIASLYDESSPLWEEIWGEHMHHGYYPPGATTGEKVDHRKAQIDMIDRVLEWAGVNEGEKPGTAVDVGCGIGGSSRHIARKYGSKVKGITLSPVQAARANQISAEQGIADKVSFLVADAMKQPFANGEFDLVWSLESGEHMPDKQKFMGELLRVVAPGGRIIVVTWCHRDLLPNEISLTDSEQALLKRICDAYYLPAWCSTADYVKIAEDLGLEDIRTADWTEFIAPFWPAVIESAISLQGFVGLLKSGLKTIRGALVMRLMVDGYKKGLIKFALITCRKPSSQVASKGA